MADEPNIILPEDDNDLILAKKIGDQIASSSDFSGLDDPLIDLLTIYSNSEQEKISRLSVRADTAWSKVRRGILDRPSTRIIPLYQRPAVRAWVAAAAVLILAFIGFYLFTRPSTQLFAESGAVIEEMTLPDGSEVKLRPYSKLFRSGDRQYTLKGEGFFSVTHDSDHPFSVKVGEARVTVLGTRFDASDWGDKPRVFLEEGRVLFENITTGKTLELQPGQASTLQSGQLQLSEPDMVRGNPYTDWINNTLVLDNSTFEDVVNEIEQHFHINISLSDPGFQADSINGSYRLASVDSTLNDIGLLVNGTFTKQSENTYKFENTE